MNRFTRADLCAQVAPLNRYGLNGLSSAIVDGLWALAFLYTTALSHGGGGHTGAHQRALDDGSAPKTI